MEPVTHKFTGIVQGNKMSVIKCDCGREFEWSVIMGKMTLKTIAVVICPQCYAYHEIIIVNNYLLDKIILGQEI